MATKNPDSKRPVGNRAFREAWERITHRDDWGVTCAYDFEAWRIWKAAIRYANRSQTTQKGDADVR